jgi:lambda family phage portal protein
VSVVSRLRSIVGLGAVAAKRAVRVVRAKFDAAANGPDHRRHWAAADDLSPDAALTPAIRRTLRRRARYEVANNCYAEGIVDTYAMSVVGTGPSLQLGLESEEDNEAVESLFAEWAEEVDLAGKLLLAERSKIESGEVFLRLVTNPGLEHPVKLDIRLIESDQVAFPGLTGAPAGEVDGIEYDANGNPARYWLLREHPGSGMVGVGDADAIDAASVIHWFRPRRPGQSRGYPEITPALPLFAYNRRFTLATVQAAETAASIAGVLYTDSSVDPDEADETLEPFHTVPIARGTWMTAPEGYRPGQMTAEHPTTTFGDFVKQLLREIARVVKMPFNIAAGDSSGYNYSSGRLDHQTFDFAIDVERSMMERKVLRRIFREWIDEAALIDMPERLLPQRLRSVSASRMRPRWIWPGRQPVDAAKEAVAEATELANTTTTLTDLLARRGKDFRAVVRKRAEELRLMRELGIPTGQNAGNQPQAAPDDKETADAA